MRGVRVANVSFEVASGINGAVCACELGAVITGTSDHRIPGAQTARFENCRRYCGS